jgi:hypothetical protein
MRYFQYCYSSIVISLRFVTCNFFLVLSSHKLFPVLSTKATSSHEIFPLLPPQVSSTKDFEPNFHIHLIFFLCMIQSYSIRYLITVSGNEYRLLIMYFSPFHYYLLHHYISLIILFLNSCHNIPSV